MQTNENQWKQLPWTPLAPNGNELKAIGDVWHRFCHKLGPLSRSIRNSTTILHALRCASFWWPQNIADTQIGVKHTILTDRKQLTKCQKQANLKIKQTDFWDMQSAAKLWRESNAINQISPKPILDTNEYAKKEVGGRGGAYKYIYNITYIYIYT